MISNGDCFLIPRKCWFNFFAKTLAWLPYSCYLNYFHFSIWSGQLPYSSSTSNNFEMKLNSMMSHATVDTYILRTEWIPRKVRWIVLTPPLPMEKFFRNFQWNCFHVPCFAVEQLHTSTISELKKVWIACHTCSFLLTIISPFACIFSFPLKIHWSGLGLIWSTRA